jgi:hypothetical protein
MDAGNPGAPTPPEGIPANEDVLSVVVEDALQQVLQANSLMLTGMIGLATFMDLEGNRYMRLLAAGDANEINSLGMARRLQMMVEDQARASD